jgi:hypothetical protein
MLITEITKTLHSIDPITLDEMESVRLMNRIDTKYVVSVSKIQELLTSVDGMYKILEINGERLFPYQTTYLDTFDYMFFDQHVKGKPERNKVRYRTYEKTGNTFLEIKRRTTKNRTIKWRIENYLSSDNQCDSNAIEFIREYIPQNPVFLKPVILNNFKRVTMTGSDMNERITMDFELSFSDISGNKADLPWIAIIEVKKEASSVKTGIEKILKDSQIRPTGFSKYCIGTTLLYDIPRKNIMKPKLLLINRIENEYNRHIFCA